MVKAGGPGSSKAAGDEAESLALQYLQRHGLTLVSRNYRVAGGSRARGGEVDLIVRDAAGTLIFVEVRSRAGWSHGGASASVTSRKQQRIVLAARHFLLRYRELPPCRFDVVAIDAGRLQWIQAAFDAA
jgi:putative endonuclease